MTAYFQSLRMPSLNSLVLIMAGILSFNSFAEMAEFDTKLAATKKWEKEREYKGFTIYTSTEEDSDIVPIKVEGVIEAPIHAIMENLRTIEGSEEWTPDLIAKTTLEDLGPREAITYSLTDMPWPLYDRKLVLHNKLHLDTERKLLFVLSKSVSFDESKVPKTKKSIEAFVGYSNLGMRPVSKEKTFVEFTAWVDPKGSIPTWVINFFQQKWPIKFFQAIEERCEDNAPALRAGLKLMLDDLLKEMDWEPNTFES